MSSLAFPRRLMAVPADLDLILSAEKTKIGAETLSMK
jgi:hypothetical protein